MDKLLNQLQPHIEAVEGIGNKIENSEEYMEEIRKYLPSLNSLMAELFQMAQNPEIGLEMDTEFVLQVLNDILYGIEHRDSVFLLDVLRYGLLEIYGYMEEEIEI